jgi:hypothetical protein
MNFKQLDVSDYDILKVFFKEQPYSLSIYSLASIIAWSSRMHRALYTISDGTLFIAGEEENRPNDRHLILPLSSKAYPSPSELHHFARKLGFDRYWYAPGDYLEKLDHSELDFYFTVEEQKEFADYVYLAEDMIRLGGNRFAKKRNLIHQFTRDYLSKDRVEVQTIRPEYTDECLKFLEIWCEQYACGEDQESSLACEKNALITTLKNMDRLESKGILIRIGGEVSAFGIGSRLNRTTATLNFEKAFSEFKGLYQFLDNECAKRLFSEFLYINKESDMNVPNLAKSKQSYNPVFRIKSYSLVLR